MLDSTTKHRIDNARDVLVGKVPDPKAQVEQITTALIYKFMDDMDQESISMGGHASFFVGEYEKFAWPKIMAKTLGGYERLGLYSQAISEMNQNPNLPQLFRDVFKDAFLPYKDPETLNLFLKEIDGFKYDHSERLGDAFEYLLSVLGSQGAAGQFRTPRHIIDFIVEAVGLEKTDSVLDPACGTAGFLISAYKHILAKHRENKLSPDEMAQLTRNFVGYDIAPEMVRLSLVNMYLHRFPNPTVFEYDTLTSEDRWDDSFDVILANPPFMTPKGGIRPHSRFSIRANRSEVLFVDYIAEHLNPEGRAGVIVPEGIIFQSSNAYKALRKMLVEENYLYAVVSLPAGVFNPYSGVKTSILLLDKKLAKQTDKILFVKIENDGFGLGAQRNQIEKNDLPKALEVINQFKNNSFKESNLAEQVIKGEIGKDGEFNLSVNRYKSSAVYENVRYPIVELGEVCEIISGQSPESEFYNENGNGLPFFQGKTEFTEKFLGKPTKWTTQTTKVSEENDILISVRAPVGPVNINNEKICIGRGLAAIRPNKEKLLNSFLFYLLRSIEGEIKGNKGSTFDSINRSDIAKIKIPLPPIEVQRDIVEEIEGYQKIIDGARMVVENWKPIIKIKPDWKFDLFENIFRKSGEGINPVNNNGKVTYIGLENIESNTGKIIGDISADYSEIKSQKNIFSENQILYGKLRPNLNKVAFPKFSGICSTDILALEVIPEIGIADFYYFFLLSQYFYNKVIHLTSGAQLPRITWEALRNITIPVPPIKEQESIVEILNLEQEILGKNKELVEIYNQKIKTIIYEIWGEEVEK